MKFKSSVTPVALLIAGGFTGSAAHATTTVDTTGWTATDTGTSITLAGSSSAQYTLGINNFIGGKAYIQGNDGALVATPGSVSYSSNAYTNGFIGAGDGNYGLSFSANGVNYHGFADVTNGGTYISSISYDVGGVPEPATWAMMMLGLGIAGGALRRSRRRQSALANA